MRNLNLPSVPRNEVVDPMQASQQIILGERFAMTGSLDVQDNSRPSGVSRRTVMKGVAWAAPTIAIASAVPIAAASLVPCVREISSTGGTYPVTVNLSGCTTSNSHWDFNFKITAATQNGTDCDCSHLRVTFFDNPKRSRLWISNSNNTGGNPTTNTNNSPRLYVQKVLAAGATATFPTTGDAVRRVGGGSPYSGYVTDSGTAAVGPITAPGTADDSLHTLINPAGGALPCSVTGPMAYYRVECGQSPNGPWTLLGDLGEINPCVPMIQATSVCRVRNDTSTDYRITLGVQNSCNLPSSNFVITRVYRNNQDSLPTGGTVIWEGNQALGTSNQITTNHPNGYGSGSSLWISFTTDGGVNTSQIRIATPTGGTCS